MSSVQELSEDDERLRQAARRAREVKAAKDVARDAIALAAQADALLDQLREVLEQRAAKLEEVRGMSIAAAARSALDPVNFAPGTAAALLSRLAPFVKPWLNNSLTAQQERFRLAAVTRERLNGVIMLDG
jgi:hypothetical protein